MTFIDRTIKPAQEEPQPPVASRPSGPVIPQKYRGTAAKQEQAEQHIGNVLGHVAPELAAEVIRRTASDERFDANGRAGLNPEALNTVLDETTREVEEYQRKQANEGFRARLEAAKRGE